jgi:hypothetical protein
MSKYNFNQPNIVSLNIESNIQDQQINHPVYAPEQGQTLSEAAAEIQKLLNQLAANENISQVDIVNAVHQ